MTTMRPTDSFIVVNGPEDGTEFPVTRSPFYIGNDNTCAVNPRLDTTVAPQHGMVSVVSDGYVIRSVRNARIFVDGKRVGTLRSRIIRPGSYIQVGHTLLALECAPDGLSSRSRGIGTISDLRYALRLMMETLGSVLLSLYNLIIALINRSFSFTGILIAGAVLAYFFWDHLSTWGGYYVRYAIYWVRTFIEGLVPGQ